MKKRLNFSVLFVFVSVALVAQFKVNSNGGVGVGQITSASQTPGYGYIFFGSHSFTNNGNFGDNGKWGIECWDAQANLFNIFKPWPSYFSGQRDYYFCISELGNTWYRHTSFSI